MLHSPPGLFLFQFYQDPDLFFLFPAAFPSTCLQFPDVLMVLNNQCLGPVALELGQLPTSGLISATKPLGCQASDADAGQRPRMNPCVSIPTNTPFK